MVPTGLHLPWCHPASPCATYYRMASSIMVESLDLGKALGDDRKALGIIESAVVGRILGTFSLPSKINHVYFLTAMVADHTKKSPSVTSADIAQSTREALVPRAQSIVDATTTSKRGWLKHDKETTRKRCRPIVRLAARPKPEARPQSGVKAEPAAREGQGH